MEGKIKVSVPRENPHVCYISRDYQQKVKDIREVTGMSLYNLLCVCSGSTLKDKASIKKFKDKVRKDGFKNIGDWAEDLISLLHSQLDSIATMDLSSVRLKKKKEANKDGINRS